MSSIYRKGGQDGYYYYQAYVYDSETGKKDKRIFHSLGTKELSEAEIQQAELDIKYERQEHTVQSKSTFTFLSQYKRAIALVMVTAMATVLLMNIFQANPEPQKVFNKQIVTPIAIPEKITTHTLADETVPIPKQQVIIDDAPIIVSKPESKPKPAIPKLTIPKHTVIRIESISSIFQQGKIYVTVDDRVSTERLMLLCKSLAEQYTEFSNIVICLYTSSSVGIELANGTNKNFSVNDHKKAWLAYYSYNPVEGDYFDDEPGKYLGS